MGNDIKYLSYWTRKVSHIWQVVVDEPISPSSNLRYKIAIEPGRSENS